MKNTNSARIFKFLLLFIVLPFYGQTDSLRVMSYNLLQYPSGTTYSRENYLSAVVNEYRPDIFTVCEMEDDIVASQVLTSVLQPLNSAYRQAVFEYNHSDPNSNMQQFLYYNSNKLVLYDQSYLITEVRDINRYDLYLKTNSLAAGDTLFLHVYVVHLKASGGTENENKRLRMLQVLTADAQTIPPEHYVLVAGDFNFYYDGEPGFAEITDTTHTPVFADPIQREGYWHNNSSFADVHTQSPNRSKGGNFVGGGMDDRFDFIFTSVNLLQSAEPLHYRTGSYAAFGNNGNCFNGNINDPACSGTYSQSLRDNLYEMSDHIPVVLTLETNHTFSITGETVAAFSLYPNPAGEWLHLRGNTDGNFQIFTPAGKIVRRDLEGNAGKWYIGDLKPGIYYVQSQNKAGIPVAFIKL